MDFPCVHRIILDVKLKLVILIAVLTAPDLSPFVESLGHVSKKDPLYLVCLQVVQDGNTYVLLEFHSSHC